MATSTNILDLEPHILDRLTLSMCADACISAQQECMNLYRLTRNKSLRSAFYQYGRKWGAFKAALLDRQDEDEETGDPPALIVDEPVKLLYCRICGHSNFWPLYEVELSPPRLMYIDGGGRLVCEDCV